MRIKITPELRDEYPQATFGSLTARDAPNTKRHQQLEEAKRRLEEMIRESYPDPREDHRIQSYQTYFKRWDRTYPIMLQVRTIKGWGRFPQVSALVDCMFLAELKNRILTSGHDLDQVRGDLTFDVSQGVESYTKLNGKTQLLPKRDLILRDEEGILASILYGPAKRTSIAPGTSNALYFAWCPYEVSKSDIEGHMNDIVANLRTVYEAPTTETRYHR